jgi:hypothetical protein
MKKRTIGIVAILLFGASARAADTDPGSTRLSEDNQSSEVMLGPGWRLALIAGSDVNTRSVFGLPSN